MTHVFNPINRVVFSLGPITMYKYSFMILLGILVAVYFGLKEAKKLGIKADDIIDGVIIIVPLSIIGARLYYVLFELDNYPSLLEAIDITSGGLAIHGAFFTAILAAYIYTKKKNINIFRTIDLMAPGFLIAQAFGRWGNFFNQEAHGGVIGGVTNKLPNLSLDQQREFLSHTLHLPKFITNQMYLYGESGLQYYHPTFLYESVWNVVGFIIMLVLRRTKLIRSGDLLVFYFIWYSTGRFFIEGMRTDSLYFGDTNIRTAQVISLAMIALGIMFAVLIRKVFKNPYYYQVLEEVEQNTNEL